jgi:hypothetical protein
MVTGSSGWRTRSPTTTGSAARRLSERFVTRASIAAAR